MLWHTSSLSNFMVKAGSISSNLVVKTRAHRYFRKRKFSYNTTVSFINLFIMLLSLNMICNFFLLAIIVYYNQAFIEPYSQTNLYINKKYVFLESFWRFFSKMSALSTRIFVTKTSTTKFPL